MGRKKKPFINKKEASHFHVVHRSQQDPEMANPDASPFVLVSSTQRLELGVDEFGNFEQNEPAVGRLPAEEEEAAMVRFREDEEQGKRDEDEEARRGAWLGGDRVDEMGFPIDGYDYQRHLRPMGHGVFVGADGRVDSSGAHVTLPPEALAGAGEALPRTLDAITIDTSSMDPDLLAALNADSDDEDAAQLEELEDDFVEMAAAEPEGGVEEFDYEAHIARLMAKACENEARPIKGRTLGDEEDEELEWVSDYEEEDDEASGRNLDRNVIDARFEQMRHEYDDYEIGELAPAEYDPEMRGEMAADDALLASMLDEFMTSDAHRMTELLENNQKAKAEVFEKAGLAAAAGGGDGEAAAAEQEQEEELTPEQEAELDRLDREEDERELVDVTSAMEAREEDRWDVETVLSTLSNLDNHPTMIKSTRQRKIKLSQKTGLPVGVLESRAEEAEEEDESESDDEGEPVDLGERRPRGETPAEKRARKAAIKAERRARRQDKKGLKTAFKQEENLQKLNTGARSQSVFSYS